jgi:hypothetical protein
MTEGQEPREGSHPFGGQLFTSTELRGFFMDKLAEFILASRIVSFQDPRPPTGKLL